MTDFSDLESLYEHIEDRTLTDSELHQIKTLFMKFRDTKHQENNPREAEKAQWEIHFLSFVLKEGEIGPEWERTSENGQVFVYPHLNLFDETIYEYLITRLDATNYPKLKARYAHILWCSPKKHKKFANIAIDSYCKLILTYEQRYEEDYHSWSQEIAKAIINAYSIACQINENVEEIKSELSRFVRLFSVSAAFSVRDLIQFMLDPKKRFVKEDFDGLENICWQIAESLSNDRQIAIDFLTLGEMVDRKLGIQSYPWTQRIAQHYEALMQLFEKAPHVALNHCMKAIENYKRIHDAEKVDELEWWYSELKDSVVLEGFREEFDSTEILKECEESAKEFVKNRSSEEIVQCLILDKGLLPTYNEVKKSMQEQIKESPLLHMLPKVVLDQSVNTAQHFGSEEEKNYFGLLSGYQLQLELWQIHLIRAVFFEAILENKLTFDVLIDFIRKYCWYGQNLPKRLTNNQTIPYNWLNLIAPALNEYFRQMNFFFADPTINFPDFVLTLDSLTLKIEGLFRDLCQLSGVAISYQKRDKSGRNIAHEKDINALLHEDAIKKLFDEDDLLFFKYNGPQYSGHELSKIYRLTHRHKWRSENVNQTDSSYSEV